jgi:hypothetical protein
MLGYSLILQALHAVVWTIVLVGSVVLLRRGYASAGVSMLLGSAVAMLMAAVNLSFIACQTFGWVRGINLSKMTMMVGLVSVVGFFLFALGFLQLARTIKRER